MTILLVVGSMLLAGCSDGAIATIRNEKVIRDYPVPIETIPKGGVDTTIVLRATPGEHVLRLSPSNMNIQEGVFTIEGKDGRLEFLPGREVHIHAPKQKTPIEVSTHNEKDGWPIVTLGLSGEFAALIDWENVHPPQREVCAMRKLKPAQLGVPLEAPMDGESHLVRFTLRTSDDFVGAVGDWEILSNWN